jgi:hypothetical protein
MLSCLQNLLTQGLSQKIKLNSIPNVVFVENVDYFVRFEFFTAVTMKNVVFWDMKPQLVLHRRHITSPLQSPDS